MTDPVCVEHTFGTGNDMFSGKPLLIERAMTRTNPRFRKDPDPKPDTGTLTIEVTTYPGTTETFHFVDDASLVGGFLRIVQGETVTSFNTQDVSRTVSYP